MTTTILIIINVFAALGIIVLVLMQQSKGDMGSAFGGGGSQSMFGSRGSANFLSRSTSVLCTVFFITSLALAYVYAKRGESNTVVQDSSVLEQQVETSTADSEIPNISSQSVSVEAGDSVTEVPAIIADGVEEAATEVADKAESASAEAAEQAENAIENAVENATEAVQQATEESNN